MPHPTSRKSTSTADTTVLIVSHTPLLNLHTLGPCQHTLLCCKLEQTVGLHIEGTYVTQ